MMLQKPTHDLDTKRTSAEYNWARCDANPIQANCWSKLAVQNSETPMPQYTRTKTWWAQWPGTVCGKGNWSEPDLNRGQWMTKPLCWKSQHLDFNQLPKPKNKTIWQNFDVTYHNWRNLLLSMAMIRQNVEELLPKILRWLCLLEVVRSIQQNWCYLFKKSQRLWRIYCTLTVKNLSEKVVDRKLQVCNCMSVPSWYIPPFSRYYALKGVTNGLHRSKWAHLSWTSYFSTINMTVLM